MRPDEPFLLRPGSEQWLRDQAGPLPGTVPRGCVLIPIVVAVMGIALFCGGRWQQGRVDSFKRNLATAKGLVIDRRVNSTLTVIDAENGIYDSEDEYHVSYRFSAPAAAGQRQIDAESSVSKETYEGLKQGDEVTVHYDSTNPSFSTISGATGPAPFVLIGFGTMLVVIGLIGVLVVLVARHQKLALAREGEMLEGHIVSCTSRKDSEDRLLVDVKYQFVSPSGQEITASATAARPDLSELTLPAAHTPVIVLYASDSNYQLM